VGLAWAERSSEAGRFQGKGAWATRRIPAEMSMGCRKLFLNLNKIFGIKIKGFKNF
jgi:hypothetical protein